MKIEKKKLNQKMKELRVTYLTIISISSHLFLFFFLFISFSNIFLLVCFSNIDKDERCLYRW